MSPAITRTRLILFILAVLAIAAEIGWFALTPTDKPRSFIDLPPLFVGAWMGDSDNQYRLGAEYFSGEIVARNADKGFYWLKRSAAQGDVRAKRRLMYLYLLEDGDKMDYAGAGRYMRESALVGENDARNKLAAAMYYCRGKIPARIESQVQLKYCMVAAEAGFPDAQRDIAFAYHEGNAVTLDKAKAAQWFKRAAQQGDAGAAAMLGILYQTADGVPRDPVEAYAWYSIGAKAEDERVSHAASKNSQSLKPTLSTAEIDMAEKRAADYARSFRKELQK